MMMVSLCGGEGRWKTFQYAYAVKKGSLFLVSQDESFLSERMQKSRKKSKQTAIIIKQHEKIEKEFLE